MIYSSDSSVQLGMEAIAIGLLNNQLSCELVKGRTNMNDSGVTVEVDGHDPVKRILCEVYCGIDDIKAGQAKKVITDAFKLMLFEKIKGEQHMKILLFIDEAVMARFQSKSWYSFAFKEFGIDVMTVKIPDNLMDNLRLTKQQQYR